VSKASIFAKRSSVGLDDCTVIIWGALGLLLAACMSPLSLLLLLLMMMGLLQLSNSGVIVIIVAWLSWLAGFIHLIDLIYWYLSHPQ